MHCVIIIFHVHPLNEGAQEIYLILRNIHATPTQRRIGLVPGWPWRLERDFYASADHKANALAHQHHNKHRNGANHHRFMWQFLLSFSSFLDAFVQDHLSPLPPPLNLMSGWHPASDPHSVPFLARSHSTRRGMIGGSHYANATQ